MGTTWVLSAPDGSHVGLMNLAIWDSLQFYNKIGWEEFRLEKRCVESKQSVPEFFDKLILKADTWAG